MRIGTSELLLILVVALFVLGPEKLPVYAKKLGKALTTLKSYTGKLTEEINESIIEPLEEVKKPLKDMAEPLTNISKEVSQPMEDLKNSIRGIGKPQNKAATEEISSSETEAVNLNSTETATAE
ncbi:MAG: twin-arginine translocase subunit TatB [Eubacteriaceae bacterium]|nr:twin-arginine translocase subunit TatB [Eubacteriaceae bacterium]